jgi:hypothetical protein
MVAVAIATVTVVSFAGRRLREIPGLQDDAGMTPDPASTMMTRRMVALGEVTEWSASMENILRETFCTLVGSKFAAIVAGGQPADWLITSCKALTDVHYELPDADRQAIKDALDSCRAANQARNDLIHGLKSASRMPDGAMYTIRSRKNTHLSGERRPWTPDTIHEAAGALLQAGLTLSDAIQNAFSPDMVVIADELAWEDRRRREAGL